MSSKFITDSKRGSWKLKKLFTSATSQISGLSNWPSSMANSGGKLGFLSYLKNNLVHSLVVQK